jgi:hypothetical protein
MRFIAPLLMCSACALPDPPQLPSANSDEPAEPAETIVVTPSTCDFGSVATGRVSPCELTLENIGATEVVLESVRLSESTPDEFVIQGNPPQVIAPGATSTMTVVAVPSQVGELSGELLIDDLATVPLTATAVGGCHAVASIESINGVPVVEGSDPLITPLDSVVLTATRSTPLTPEGSIIAAQWTLDERPASSTVGLGSASGSETGFSFDVAGSYRFSLTVFDSSGAFCTDSLTVVVSASSRVVVQLTWSSSDADLDLHIARQSPPAWCVDELPVAQQDVGLELFEGVLSADVYGIGVRNAGTVASDATVRIFVDGSLQNELFGNVDELWDAARIIVDDNGDVVVNVVDTQVVDPC